MPQQSHSGECYLKVPVFPDGQPIPGSVVAHTGHSTDAGFAYSAFGASFAFRACVKGRWAKADLSLHIALSLAESNHIYLKNN